MASMTGDMNESPTLSAQALLDEPGAPVIVFDHVELAFDEKVVLRDLSFTLLKGHTKIILGASGSGKSTSLKIITGLLRADAGVVWVNGQRVDQLTEHQMMSVREDLGMIFQEGALFDSLTVGQNVGYRLIEDGTFEEEEIEARVREMLGFVGLATHYDKMPSDLSGGQKRRVAFARALVARPQIMFYDEPTTGLDPITATTITDLICKVRDLDGVSSILVTHQLRDAFNVARTFMLKKNGEFVPSVVDDLSVLEGTEFLMLKEGEVEFEGSAHELQESGDPYIREFLS
jgi:phospholipid/cholesterol/gamma-HCH transport system ATP-binding protein